MVARAAKPDQVGYVLGVSNSVHSLAGWCPSDPQPPTALFCDNKCAVQLANKAITPKHSKSICLRFHWIQDRVRQGEFNVVHIPGATNLADFFTKPLPVFRHLELAPFIASDLPTVS